jgi:hypothetical protein
MISAIPGCSLLSTEGLADAIKCESLLALTCLDLKMLCVG